MDGSIIIGHAIIASRDLLDKSKLCHLRLRHVRERSLVELYKQDLIGSKKLNELEV